MPRIISGIARGTVLFAPKGQQTRPTSDKVKEALFSILMPRLPAKGFLDIYAGTGQMGLEAASRGSSEVVLVEQQRQAVSVIRRNIEKTHLNDAVQLLTADGLKAARLLFEQQKTFDLIFLDPPYRQAVSDFKKLSDHLPELLNADGLVILEHDARDLSPDFVTNLKLERRCQYGTTMLSFYKVDDSADPTEQANEATNK